MENDKKQELTVVHVQTIVQTTFGFMDADGNIIEQKQIQIQIPVLKPEVFTEAGNKLIEAKGQLSK